MSLNTLEAIQSNTAHLDALNARFRQELYKKSVATTGLESYAQLLALIRDINVVNRIDGTVEAFFNGVTFALEDQAEEIGLTLPGFDVTKTDRLAAVLAQQSTLLG